MNGYAVSGILLIAVGIIFLFLRVERMPAEADLAPDKEDSKKFDPQKLYRYIGFLLVACGLVFLLLSVTLF